MRVTRVQTWVLVLAAVTAASVGLAAKREKQKKPKIPELEVLTANAHRAPQGIELDGKVKNAGIKPLHGLTLYFTFYADEKKPLTTQNAPIDEAVLEPGQEATYRFAMRDVPRAVSFTIDAMDHDRRELGVTNPGPFPLE
jgi:predicted component of type VI protein secretion system